MGVSLAIVLVIVAILLSAAAAFVLGMRMARRRRDVDMFNHGAPSLVMPMASRSVVRPRSEASVPHLRPMPRPISVVAPDDFKDDEFLDDDFLVGEEEMRDAPARVAAPPDIEIERPRLVEGNAVRFYQQGEDGTLEFLPGRLEVVGGSDLGQEIHFVRPRDQDVPLITFGRSDGPPHRHIQLLDGTVSRRHARMSFNNDRWLLTNLSRTNPVQVNGAALPNAGPAVTLTDGDRIEMGAVVFVFREK
jgi:hypothetical protein